MAVARYTLAVDRKFRQNAEESADFLRIVAFGKGGEFAEKYFRKGMRVAVTGHIQTGSYTGKDGQKVYTTDIVAEDQEFADGKVEKPAEKKEEDFMSVPDGIDEELPFA